MPVTWLPVYIKNKLFNMASQHPHTKTIYRPIVNSKGYNAPSTSGAIEFNSIKRENKSLFAEFTGDKALIALRKANLKLAKLRAQMKLVWASRPVGHVSFAELTARKAVSSGGWSSPPEPKSVALISRAAARRDYTAAYKQQSKEREEARALVQAMANRRPFIRRVAVTKSVDLVSKAELKQARQNLAKERRVQKPKEVKEFSPFCYRSEQYTFPEGKESWVKDRPKQDKEFKSFATSVKQIKLRWDRVSHHEATGVSKPDIKFTRFQRRQILIQQLSKTVFGRALLVGLLRVQAQRMGRSDEAINLIKSCVEMDDLIQPQMDPEGTVGQVAQEQSQASNTTIDSVQPVNKGIPHSFTKGFQNFSVSQEVQDYTTLSNRWIQLGNFSWKVSHGVDKELYQLKAPTDIIANNANAQNMQLFYTHRWFRGDMRIRFVLNSNAFQMGLAIASVVYGAKGDTFHLWNNVYAAVQRNHARLNAGSSNDAELVIPFKWYNSVMGYTDDAHMCRVVVSVLTPLTVASGVQTSCSVSVFATFENIEYFGMISRDLGVQPQMDTVANLMNVGSNLIRTLNADGNRDKPPLPLQPVSLIPQAMTSLAYMDGQAEPINVLRADSRGQTPHVDVNDEMDPYKLMRGWGYLNSFNWTMRQRANTQLCFIRVVPLLNMDIYPSLSGEYALPPIAYISSMFGFWRGDIEFRFEFVATKFHTGRLMIGSVPLFKEESISMDRLKYSAYRIADIADTTEVIFRAPWQWRNAFAKVRYGKTTVDIPSTLFVLVVNPLIAIDSVPQAITVNIYVRAADNFEVAVPRAQILDPCYSDALVPPSNEYLKPYNLENKWYTTWERNLDRSDGKYLCTIYIQNITDGWVGYTNVQEGVTYKLQSKTTKGRDFACYIKERGSSGSLEDKRVSYGVYDPALSTANAHGLVVFSSVSVALTFAKNLSKMDAKEARSAVPTYWEADSGWSQVLIDGQWVEAPNDGDVPIWEYYQGVKEERNEVEDFEVLPQMDSQVSSVVTALDIPSLCTSKGLSIFGELTPDLKSLCRRYNHYTSIRTSTSVEASPRDAPYAARIRVHPLRSVKPISSASYDNRFRHGIITNIGAMYRLWRGGLRFRFVVIGAPPEGTTLYVQHRFDMFIGMGSESEEGPKKVLSKDDMMNTQYATFAQALSVNSTFTIEVPYYQPLEASSLMPGAVLTETRDNGSLYLWLHNKVKADIHIEVFYSFADDTRYSVFQGVPLCKDLSAIAPEPQGDGEPSAPIIQEESKRPQGFFSDIVASLRAPKVVAEQVVEVSTDVKETTSALRRTLDSLKGVTDKLSGVKDSVADKAKSATMKLTTTCLFDYLATMKDSIFSVITHFIYVILSPTLKTIAWALCNLYHKIFGFTMDGLTVVSDYVRSCWQRMTSSPSKLPQGDLPEPQGDVSPVGAYAGLLFTTLATMCRVVVKPPNSWDNVSQGLFAFSQATRGGSFVTRFFEDNVELLQRIWKKFLGVFGVKDQENIALIAGIEDARLKNWLLETTIVCAPHNLTRTLQNPEWSQKVFELAIVGRSLQILLVNMANISPRISSMVSENVKALKVLEKRLIDSKVYSGVRYEPWTMWVGGCAGTGKTRYLQHVASKLAEELKYEGQIPYHTITAGQKYMDGFVGQPSILLDDFMTMAPSSDPESYAQFLQMASSALFNPPFAIAEEKNKLVNFQNLLVSSNTLFVGNLPGISDPEAYNRRRKVLLEFTFRHIGITADNLVDEYTPEALADLDHVKVFIYDSPSTDRSDYAEIKRVEGETYRETVDKVVFAKAAAHHKRESEAYGEACRKISTRLESLATAGNTLGDQIASVSKELDEFASKGFFSGSTMFADWISKCKKESSFIPSEVEAQGEKPNPFLWPSNWKEIPEATNLDTVEPSPKPIEPLDRQLSGQPPYKGGCLHKNFDYEFCDYLKEYGVFSSHRIVNPSANLAMSMPVGPCLAKREDGQLVPCDNCLWVRKPETVYGKLFINPMDKLENFSLIQMCNANNDWSPFEDRYPEQMVEWIKATFSYRSIGTNMATIAARISRAQQSVASTLEKVDDVLVPKRPLWQRIPICIWNGLIAVLKFIPTLLKMVFSTILLILTICTVTSMCVSKAPIEEAEPNLHPSGDYKTIRNAKSIKTRAFRMMEGEGGSISDQDIVKSCESKSQSNGVISRVVSNVFFMVGKVPVSDTTFVSYRARCVGLYNKTFLVIKHYIEHFKAQGVKDVCIVLHGGTTMIEYPLDYFKFSWTEQGYGISSLPASFPRMFKDITKYIPSESFDGNYPSECIAVEVFADTHIEHSITVKRLSQAVTIPATTTQTSWTITQGLTYAWGGTGKCGSLILAPSMACPLIGLHTAGVGSRLGFSELLLKETFKNSLENVIEYVTPQMDQSEGVYGLEGFYEQVGKLDYDMVPRLAIKTKIEPSEIHTVFPVTTQPAPLISSDPRLSIKEDILRLGVSKRCNPIGEFREGAVHSAFLHYFKLISKVVKPTRASIAPLTVVEACEGLTVEGYDSLEFSTSEGYPWTTMRPKNASDKSWLFKLSNYPDGRIKVEGLYGPLLDTIQSKERMRERDLVPASYFTTCLKDARIPLHKIPIPGSTRVFEMSPVDLTIAQRQYFLDFTVAYRKARFQAEHSIGINPDGIEWTELADWLGSFSPCILTADYSGYGPRLSHTLLERAFDVGLFWLMDNEDCSQEEADRRCSVRECLKHEVTHGLHIVKDLVFRPTCGLPSGNCETVEKNSQTNSLYIRIAFLELAKLYAPQFQDLYWFNQKVRLVTNGDDLIASVKEDIISWFNNRTLIEFFATVGLKMTDSLKSGVVREFCSLEEASYLKRSFLPHPTRDGHWLAPLEENSITDTANWVWRSVDGRAASLVNSEQACRLAYTRGPEFYNRIASKIQIAWKQRGVNFEYPPWQLLDSHVWEGTEGPKFCF